MAANGSQWHQTMIQHCQHQRLQTIVSIFKLLERSVNWICKWRCVISYLWLSLSQSAFSGMFTSDAGKLSKSLPLRFRTFKLFSIPISSGSSLSRFSANESSRNWLQFVIETGILVSRLQSSINVCNFERRPMESGKHSRRLSLIANSSRLFKLYVDSWYAF